MLFIDEIKNYQVRKMIYGANSYFAGNKEDITICKQQAKRHSDLEEQND